MKRRFAGLTHIAPVVEAHLHGDFDRGGAVVRVEAAGEPGGAIARERFGQRDDGLVGEAGEDDVLELLQLRRAPRR